MNWDWSANIEVQLTNATYGKLKKIVDQRLS